MRSVVLLSVLAAAQAFSPSAPGAFNTLHSNLHASATRLRTPALGLKMRFQSDGVSHWNRRDFITSTSSAAAGLLLGDLLAPAKEASAAEGPVVVFGANGYTGGDVMRTLLKKGIPVTAVTKFKEFKVAEDQKNRDLATVHVANVAKPESFMPLLEGARAIIYADDAQVSNAGTDRKDIGLEEYDEIENIGVKNVAKAAIQMKVPQLVLCSSTCKECDPSEVTGPDDFRSKVCSECDSRRNGEAALREAYAAANDKALGYTVVRPGTLTLSELRGPSEVEFNQGMSKSGMISRLDLAEVLTAAAQSKDAQGSTFEVYYKDTAQPTDMFASLKTCQGLGKSVEECFFGDGFKDKKPELDDLMNQKVKGTLFASGREVLGSNYNNMFKKLSKDVEDTFDLNELGFSSS